MTPAFSASRFWLTVMLPFGVGYFVTLIFRTVNAVLAHPLQTDLGINNAQLGLISAMFMLGTAAAQLPLGVLLDMWGARRTQALFFCAGAAGIFLFAIASDATLLAIGRAILGVGVAGGLMAAFKAIADRVDPDDIPFYNGIIMACGGLGVLAASVPAKLFEVEFGWRALCITLAVLTLLTALLIVISGRDEAPAKSQANGFAAQLEGLKMVYSSRDFWSIAPLLGIANGGFIAIQGLWAGPWLQHVEGRDPIHAAHYLFIIGVATTASMLAGGPLARLSRRIDIPLSTVAAICIAIHIGVQILIVTGIAEGTTLIWIAYGFFGQVVLVYYAVIAQRFGAALAGRAVTAANVLVFFYAFVAQTVFGLIVHLWPQSDSHPEFGYRIAFATLIAVEVIAFAAFVVQALAGRRAGRAADKSA